MSSGENVGETKRGLSGIDLGIGNISISHTLSESFCVGTDESSVVRAKSDVADAELLLAFNSISVSERLEPKDGVATDCINFDAFDPIGQSLLSRQKLDNCKDTCKHNSSDLASIAEPSGRRDGAAEVFVGVDRSSKLNHPLIVYTSSQRSAHSKESQKTSRRRRMASRNSLVNLGSLQKLRKSRSSFSKRAQSSVWGCVANALPDSEESSRTDLNLGNEKMLTVDRGSKGKSKSHRSQTGQVSIGKRCTPTGHISLKIKIGNKICSMNNATEEFTPARKDILELYDAMGNKLGEEVPEVVIPPHESNSEKVMSDEACALRTHPKPRSTFDKPSFNFSSDFHSMTSPEDRHNLGVATENMCSDIGTSPDSEVINSVLDGPLCEKGLPDLQESPIISKVCASPDDISSLILSPKKFKKETKKDNLHPVGKCTLKIKLPVAESLNNAKVSIAKGDVSSLSIPKTKSKKGKKKNKLHEVGDGSMKTTQIATEARNDAKVPLDYKMGEKAADGVNTSSKPYSNSAEATPCSGPVATVVPSNSKVCNGSIPCSNGLSFTKHSRGKGGSKDKSRIIDMPNKKNKTSKRKGNKNSASGESQANKKLGANGALRGAESCLAAGNQTPFGLGESGVPQSASIGVREHYSPLRNAWVLCDECQKWRRIPATLADQIEETNCGWTCKENTDIDFADCSIPQEKSNSEINEELEISEASCEDDAGGTFLNSNQNQPKVPQQSSWSLIKSNLFLHRSRKTQTIDEVMVCHCKPPSDGKMGCGAKCLNRMLNIECVRGTCPCGELCSNQQFQKRKYAKLKWFRCGKKGYGLEALDDISQGQFLIEYVGEVLDVHAYEARQREYALDGHRHFYFMTLNGSEVIDACAKGNLARFINHSCSPNCRTEKWMVNGEVCVGLFAVQDIKKGEEVTFDYNYVRVIGAAAKKCVCGSPNCRGYIGGDPTSSEVIVQDDSDDEFSEPVMTCGDRELNEDWRDIMLNCANGGAHESANERPENRDGAKKVISPVEESIIESYSLEPLTQRVEGVCSAQLANTVVRDTLELGNSVADDHVEQLDTNNVNGEFSSGTISTSFKADSEGVHSQIHSSSQFLDISLRTDGIPNKEMSSAHGSLVTAGSPSKSLSGTVESKRKLKYATVGERGGLATSGSLSKTKHSAPSVGKGKPKTNILNGKGMLDMDKLNATLNKSQKLPELNINGHFEAVEEKLNELLDPEGGISKRKDASRGYLKLLFLTAASGNNGHGEAIQSNRDLSMILDALLKTKSRTVLVDIINKNGLQMLHNIMKRYRKDFIKTPILRKLLKVLEHLALREILTLEHITGGPPCVGVESFKDSMLVLTEHDDRQVHQIARNFRDRWIPRSLRKNYCIERDNVRNEFNQHPSYGDLSVSNEHAGDKGGKSSEVISSSEKQSLAAPSTSTPDLSSVSGSSSGTNRGNTLKRKSRWDNPVAEHSNSRIRTNLASNDRLNLNEDMPPGFSSPCNAPVVRSDPSSNAVHHHSRDIGLGDSQRRFAALLPVSYGVPYSIMQQIGVRAESSDGWTVAPAVPFHPFPPLPPYARGDGPLPSPATSENHTRTCNSNSPENNLSVSNRQPDFQQGASSLGRKYFRQQKWNHSKLAPPWVRMRSGYNTRNDSPGVSSINGANDFRNAYNSQEANWREL